MRVFLQSTATLIGMIVGVGIFGVPYVVAQVGFVPGLAWILGIGLLILAVHLLYGEVVTATSGRHRLPGYAERYLGRPFKHILAIAEVLGYWGASVAYIIVGGRFLALLFEGSGSFIFSALIFAAVAIITFFGVRVLGRVEFWMTALLLLTVLIIMLAGALQINPANLRTLNFGFWLAPFGVVLFALTGVSAIPEMFDISGRRRAVFFKSIILGSIVPVAVTALFAWVVVGISGTNTTAAAFDGLQAFLNSWVMKLGIIFGFLAVTTSYLVLALYLKELFEYDYRVKKFPAWLVGVGVPFLLFAAGARDFIRVIDITGGIFTALIGVFVPLIAVVVMRRRRGVGRFAPRIILAMCICAIFSAIVAYKVISFLL